MRSMVGAMALLLGVTGGLTAEAADYAGPHRHGRHASYRHARAPIGQCVRTRVASIDGVADAAVIRYRDGVVQQYDPGMLGHTETRPGDPIQLCLISFSRDCGDDELPGRTYAVGNLRTGAAWTLPDVRSSCVRR